MAQRDRVAQRDIAMKLQSGAFPRPWPLTTASPASLQPAGHRWGGLLRYRGTGGVQGCLGSKEWERELSALPIPMGAHREWRQQWSA